jgi:5-formyltetrahydrofolate cyclo-ligase
MDPATVRDRKRALREEARALVLDPEAGERAQARLGSLPVWREARCVALDAAWRAEPPTGRLASRLARAGVVLAWPRIEDERMVLRTCPGAELVPGYRGIPEPPASAPVLAPEGVDAFVVPGLLFDRRGARLGRGRGHWDRLLSGARSDSLRIGFTVEARLVDELPLDEWDVQMHRIVTEAGVHLCR